MDKYYYLVAQLPALVFDKDSGMDIPVFLEEAGKWLSKRDLDVLRESDLNDMSSEKRGPSTMRSYRSFERDLRQRVAAWRRSRRDGEEPRLPGFPVSLLREGHPLDVEKKLLKHRWDFIDAMERDHDFDLDFLILFSLKLQILARLSRFDAEKGIGNYDGIVSAEYAGEKQGSSESTAPEGADREK